MLALWLLVLAPWLLLLALWLLMLALWLLLLALWLLTVPASNLTLRMDMGNEHQPVCSVARCSERNGYKWGQGVELLVWE